MTRLLFDTTLLIDAARGGVDVEDVIDDADDVVIAAVTIAELRAGALLTSSRRKSTRMAFVDDIVATIPVINDGPEVAEIHAALLVEARAQGKPRGAHDLIIAATARASDRTILSADRTAFRNLPGVSVHSHR